MNNELAILGGQPVRTKPFPAWPVFGAAEEQRLVNVLRGGQWGRLSGNEVANFEKRFAAFQGARYGLAVVNGTVSLRIALLAAGIEAGDEVIVPAYTFIATAACVIEANAVPVFVDIEPDTYNIDPGAVAAAITPRTRAIIPVHFAGQAADMDALEKIAHQHNLVIIEDAAHAHGATFRGRGLGSIGALGSFSFQSSKNLTSGEGGLITTNDEKLYDACFAIHHCGRLKGAEWYEHGTFGANYRLSEFQGALLDSQLDRLEEQTKIRDANGPYLAPRLEKIPGIRPMRRPPFVTRHSYHLFMLRYSEQEFGLPRASFIKAVTAEGVPVFSGYSMSLPRQQVFRDKAFGPYTGWRSSCPKLDYTKAYCPVSDKACESEALWILQPVLLGERQDMDDIVTAFAKVHQQRDKLRAQAGELAAVRG